MKKLVYPLVFVSLLSISPLALSETKAVDNGKETAVQMKKDGDVMGWVEAIDSFEVKVSELALDKKVEGKVKDFADMLHSDHSKNLSELKDLGAKLDEKSVETPALKSFKKDGDAQYKKLSGKDEKDFPKAFIDAMVKGHEGALKKIDGDLMKKVVNPELKTFVEETRKMVAHHLEEAKAIQKEMKG